MWFSAGFKGAILAFFAWAISMYWADMLGLYNQKYDALGGVVFGSFIGAIIYGLDVARKKERSGR